MRYVTRFTWVLALVAVLGSAHGGVSLTLGVVLPGWDEVESVRFEEAAEDLAKDYARQLGHACIRPEVFVRSNTRTVMSALLFYEVWLPAGSTENVVLDDWNQRVSLISKPYAYAPVLSVLLSTDMGVILILC